MPHLVGMIKQNPSLLKTKSPLTIIGLFCLFLLLISSCSEAKTPAEVTRLFWDALINNDIETAQKYTTLPSQQQVKIDPDLNINNTVLKIGEIRINDQQATVQTLFVYQKPEAKDQKPDLNINTYLLKDNGMWKVDFQKTTRLLPGKAFRDLMQSLQNLTQSYIKKLEEQAPLIEEKIESLNEQLIEEIEELNRKLEKPESTEKPSPSTKSI